MATNSSLETETPNLPVAAPHGELSRELSLFKITMMGLGMMIGAGVFIGMGISIGRRGPAELS